MALTSGAYRNLATYAARELGTSSSSVIAAILAQWTCELGAGDAYPPRRNNPGNLAQGFARATGIPFRVEYPNPQPGNPIVTFGSPIDGARAYAFGIRVFDRYNAAQAAAARGDGLGFINGITAASWGTNKSCWLGAYRSLGGSVPAGDPGQVPAGGSSSSGPLEEFLATIGRKVTDPVRSEDVIPFLQFLQRKGIAPPGPPNQSAGAGAVERVLRSLVGRPWSDAGHVFLESAAAAGNVDPFGVKAAAATVGQAIGDAAVTAVVNVAILTVIVVLGYKGATSLLNAPAAA